MTPENKLYFYSHLTNEKTVRTAKPWKYLKGSIDLPSVFPSSFTPCEIPCLVVGLERGKQADPCCLEIIDSREDSHGIEWGGGAGTKATRRRSVSVPPGTHEGFHWRTCLRWNIPETLLARRDGGVGSSQGSVSLPGKGSTKSQGEKQPGVSDWFGSSVGLEDNLRRSPSLEGKRGVVWCERHGT